jgi:hypothetical protein
MVSQGTRRLAGQIAERLALSDGVFNVAMTPLVLDLRATPPKAFTTIRTSGEFG